jgi:hypothetical protein
MSTSVRTGTERSTNLETVCGFRESTQALHITQFADAPEAGDNPGNRALTQEPTRVGFAAFRAIECRRRPTLEGGGARVSLIVSLDAVIPPLLTH